MDEKEKKKSIIREFGLTSQSINNSTSIIILTFIIVIMGFYIYKTIPKESFPEIVIPTVLVSTPYPGNSPVDIENLITRPIEKELKSISGIKDIKSTSVQDFSTIVVEFNPEEDITKSLQDVKDAVDKSKSELPDDLDNDPDVQDIDLTELPIMFINIAGNYSNSELKSYAEYLEDEIEKLSEISKCEIKGALEREIRIAADIHKMESMEVSFKDISDAISSENITLSGGTILANKYRMALRVDGEFKTVDEINDVIVKDENQRIVYVRDIATVSDTYKERSSYSRSSLLPVVTVDVIKRGGENLLITADKIKKIIAEAQRTQFPDDLQITITNDQSKFTKSMVANLENSIITGMILVVVVLMFFMGFRNALFVGVAIPLSMLMAFIILSFIGYSVNMVVLFGLILALGMLVDNGIVVVENIYRLMQRGYKPIRAAKEGAGEVAMPIITSTLTTVAAFLPLAFWTGIMGEFMKFLPITLIIVLSSSLFVALVINPVMTSLLMKVEKKKVNRVKILIISGSFAVVSIPFYFYGQYTIANILYLVALGGPLNLFILRPVVAWFQDAFIPNMEELYARVVRFALNGAKPWFFFFGTVFLMIFSIGLFFSKAPMISLFPKGEPNYINIFIEEPIGVDIKQTNKLSLHIEKVITDVLKPYEGAVESIIAQVGEGANDPNQISGQQTTPNKARINVSFVEYDKRQGISTQEIMNKIREALTIYPGVTIKIDKDRKGPPVGSPINIELSGENYERLIALSEKIMKTIDESNIRGIQEMKTDLELGKPELLIKINRDKAQRFGLSTFSIANELRTALYGKEVSKYKEGEDEYPIELRLQDKYRYNIDALLNKKVTFRDNKGKIKSIPISSVASVDYTTTYGSVKRKDLDRVITFYSNVNEGYNANEIVSDLKILLNDMELPEGYTLKFTGEQEEQEKSSEFLTKALLIAIFSIFLIIVAQFNSFTTPFIIMMSVLFSTIGVFLGLEAFQMDFIIIMTGIGIISLAGVVVNNAIVLIDYTNLVRKRKRAELELKEDENLSFDEVKSCIVEAGSVRLRPVLLTAITTVLGLIPLATGTNIDYFTLLSSFDPHFYFGGDSASFWGPMAWTVIFGLVFATFLTLVLVPVMYLMTDRVFFKKKSALRERKE